MAKTDPIDPNNPKGTADPKQGDNQIRKTNAGIIEIINVDHYVGANTTDVGYQEDAAGEHLQATLHERTSPVSVDANKGVVFAKVVSGVAELFYIDENEAEVQLTSGGTIKAGTLTGNAIVTGTFESTGIATLADKSVNKTTAAPDADAQLANKKYVDDQLTAAVAAAVTLSARATDDDNSDAFVAGQTYLANTDGFVYAIGQGNDGNELQGYINSSRAVAGTVRSSSDYLGFCYAVASGETFKVTSNLVTSTVISWRSMGTLVKPTDQT